MTYLLSLITFFPLFGALLLALFVKSNGTASDRSAKILAIFTSSSNFLISLFVLFKFDSSISSFQLVEEYAWLPGFSYKLGVDGISIFFVILTTSLMPVIFLSSWNIKVRVKEYMISFLVLETFILGVFLSLDLFLFYIFFEASLIPMFLIVGIWGGVNRIYAAFKFFLYTLLGSILMLIAMIFIWVEAGTTDIPTLMITNFSSKTINFLNFEIIGGLQTLLWICFFASFAVKLPMWPFHTWLPDAHVQAPTSGSVVLAAILLKMGGYGFLRFSLPMFPEASFIMQDFVYVISVTAIIYTSLVALMQKDIKKLIAYSSVAHMGFVTIGIFSFNQQGLDGAIFQMLSHGFISAALFLLIGVIYDRMHTREIDAFGGIVSRMPIYALLLLFFTMANIGLPGTSGFVGEFLTLLGTFKANPVVAFFSTLGVVLSAAYALWLYKRVVFGELIKESLKNLKDMSAREVWVVVPLVVATLFLGIYPSIILDVTGLAVENLLIGLNLE